MRLLFLKWQSIGNEFIIPELKNHGIDVVEMTFDQHDEDTRRSEEFAAKIAQKIITEQAEMVFSFNYFATAAIACNACKVLYVSWTYDSPLIQLYSKTISLPTNVPFVFDREEAQRLNSLGADNVRYLPLCAPVEYYDSLENNKAKQEEYSSDIAFVGSMYKDDKNNLFRHLDKADDYTKGYIEGIFAAQHEIYGSSIIEQSLTHDIVEKIQKTAPIYASGDGLESAEWVIANYYLARKLTGNERTEFVEALKERFEKVRVFGKVDYYNEAPFVMKNAKINLNISLRSIVNAIPLRIFDIMGNQGFLLTDYRGEMQDYFAPGEEFDYFDSKAMLLDKCDYYLKNERERQEIARKGYENIKKNHSYKVRVEQILDYLGV